MAYIASQKAIVHVNSQQAYLADTLRRRQRKLDEKSLKIVVSPINIALKSLSIIFVVHILLQECDL